MIFAILFQFIFSAHVEAAVRFPVVSFVEGQHFMLDKEGQKRKLTKGSILKEKAVIETINGRLRIELDEVTGLMIHKNSIIKFPLIGFEHGDVKEVLLQKGTLRVHTSGEKQRFYTTSLSRDIYQNSDFMLRLDPAVANLKLSVFSGQIEFRGLEGEKTLKVIGGQEAAFQGVIENGDIAYDVLLQGRKVARGVVDAQPKNLKDEELQALSKSYLIEKPIVKKVEKKISTDEICQKPVGKLDECAWKCVTSKKMKLKSCRVELPTVSCRRFRCLANGEWGDEFILPADQNRCGLKPLVAPCDY